MAESGLPVDALLAAAGSVQRFGAVPIIFADAAALYLLDNWLAHARRAGAIRTLLVALDDAAEAHSVGPDCAVVRARFAGDLSDLWQLLLRVFELLARQGIDFVHSDLDAVWLGDPRTECFADDSLHAVFSQGTFHPQSAHAAWGFVLCCGLFAVRGDATGAGFLAAVRAQGVHDRDDQVAVNRVLLDAGTVWEPDAAGSYAIRNGERSFLCHRRMLRGACAALGMRVGLLAFHRVPRLATPLPGAIVKHPFSTRDPPLRIAVLRQSGVWLDRAPAD